MKPFAKPDRKPDFSDIFEGRLAHHEKSARELAEYALANSPAWFLKLFQLRQFFARLVGLKTQPRQSAVDGTSFLLAMPVIEDSDDVYEAGISDRHLDFTLRLEKVSQSIRLSTTIWFNNWAGRIYLALVRPFHNRICAHYVKVLGERL